MKRWKAYLDRRAIKRLGIESWTEREKDLILYVYAVRRYIEAVDLLPFFFGLIPVIVVYREIENKIISGFPFPVGSPEGFWAAGSILLIYAATIAVLNRLIVKRLQRKWISELYQKLAGDVEMTEAYNMLKILEPDLDSRIENTFLRLNKLF